MTLISGSRSALLLFLLPARPDADSSGEIRFVDIDVNDLTTRSFDKIASWAVEYGGTLFVL